MAAMARSVLRSRESVMAGACEEDQLFASLFEQSFPVDPLEDFFTPGGDDLTWLQSPAASCSLVQHPQEIIMPDEHPPSKNSCGSKPARKESGRKGQREERIAFVVETEADELDDGYKWRKYGDKAVKRSPFRRKYYRCSNAKCLVKKHVERAANNPRLLVLTYEGQHNHHSHVLLNGVESAFIIDPILSLSYMGTLSPNMAHPLANNEKTILQEEFTTSQPSCTFLNYEAHPCHENGHYISRH